MPSLLVSFHILTAWSCSISLFADPSSIAFTTHAQSLRCSTAPPAIWDRKASMPQIVALSSLHACWPHQPASMSSLWNWPVALSGSLALESHNVAPHSVGAPSVIKLDRKGNPRLRAEGPPWQRLAHSTYGSAGLGRFIGLRPSARSTTFLRQKQSSQSVPADSVTISSKSCLSCRPPVKYCKHLESNLTQKTGIPPHQLADNLHNLATFGATVSLHLRTNLSK